MQSNQISLLLLAYLYLFLKLPNKWKIEYFWWNFFNTVDSWWSSSRTMAYTWHGKKRIKVSNVYFSNKMLIKGVTEPWIYQSDWNEMYSELCELFIFYVVKKFNFYTMVKGKKIILFVFPFHFSLRSSIKCYTIVITHASLTNKLCLSFFYCVAHETRRPTTFFAQHQLIGNERKMLEE